jgi:apolipoprotein N-acyltransferase
MSVFRFPKTTALVLGLVSATGFAPLNLWPVTLIALAVLMHLVSRAETLKEALARGYWFGAGHFALGLNWIAGSFQYQDAMPAWLGWVAVVGLALFLAIYPAMAAGLAWRWGRRGLPFVLIFAAGWIVTEYLRATLFTGFAWNPLGVSMLASGIFAALAIFFGTYGLSGLTICISGWAYEMVCRWRRGERNYQLWIEAIPFSFIIFVMMIAPWVRPQIENAPNEGTLIRIVQPNIGQQDKHNDAFDAINFAKLKGLSGTPGPEPRLILWPEAAIPDYLDEKDGPAHDARARISALLGPKDILLTGGVKLHYKRIDYSGYYQDVVVGARNSLWVMDAKGQLLGRYDKSHLVPGGEYLPMKPLLSLIGLSRLVPGTVDFWPGPGPRTLRLPGFGKVGVQICYEIIFSGHVVDRANRPDFLFNPSNDAWFGSWGPPQHLAQARLRAIEEGMPIIRSTPTGISAVIDADGNVLHQLPYKRAGYIETLLPWPHPPTVFALYGNIISLALAFFLGALGVALRLKQR